MKDKFRDQRKDYLRKAFLLEGKMHFFFLRKLLPILVIVITKTVLTVNLTKLFVVIGPMKRGRDGRDREEPASKHKKRENGARDK